MIANPIFLALVFLCWGSFLNMLGYRLISGDSILTARSFCPQCHNHISWFDLIPVVSYFILQGRCRNCAQSISILYPLIELLSMITLLSLWYYVPAEYFPAYFIYFSALLLTIRTDLEFMLISRFASIYLIPVGIALSIFGYLPITWKESMIGCMSGYFFLFTIAQVFYALTKKHGLGQGDVELIACIGTFTGIIGWWTSLLLGSCVGSCIGIMYILLAKKETSIKLPFGPFLAIASIIYVLFQNEIAIILSNLQ